MPSVCCWSFSQLKSLSFWLNQNFQLNPNQKKGFYRVWSLLQSLNPFQQMTQHVQIAEADFSRRFLSSILLPNTSTSHSSRDCIVHCTPTPMKDSFPCVYFLILHSLCATNRKNIVVRSIQVRSPNTRVFLNLFLCCKPASFVRLFIAFHSSTCVSL